MMSVVLGSDDLRLIPLAPEHCDKFTTLANLSEINQQINKPYPYGKDHFAELIKKLEENARHYVWMIEASGNIVGVINTAAHRNPFIYQGGYWIHPPLWGKGYASQALGLVKDFLFCHSEAIRLQAVVEPDNVASIRVLEKCGYVREGLLRKYYPSHNRGLIDILMYACIKP